MHVTLTEWKVLTQQNMHPLLPILGDSILDIQSSHTLGSFIILKMVSPFSFVTCCVFIFNEYVNANPNYESPTMNSLLPTLTNIGNASLSLAWLLFLVLVSTPPFTLTCIIRLWTLFCTQVCAIDIVCLCSPCCLRCDRQSSSWLLHSVLAFLNASSEGDWALFIRTATQNPPAFYGPR